VIGEARYEAETSRHMHFVCQNCGRIQNIVSDEIEIEARLKKKGMRMDSLIAYGVCRDCS
jgi:Fe2+ or Zn2+ uptake regulation protein